MSNKNNPIIQKHNEIKYKIYLKDDPEEKPFVFRDEKMIFRTKFSSLVFFREIKKQYPEMEFQWIRI